MSNPALYSFNAISSECQCLIVPLRKMNFPVRIAPLCSLFFPCHQPLKMSAADRGIQTPIAIRSPILSVKSF